MRDQKRLYRRRPGLAELTCGLGMFSLAASKLGLPVVWAQEEDENARAAYAENFGMEPYARIPG